MREYRTMTRALKIVFVLIASLTLSTFTAHAQIVPTGDHSRAQKQPDAVTYLFPEQVTVAAGKPSAVALHFRIAPGLHVNSHTPSEDYLIPTTLSIPATAGVRLDAANYPNGTEITLPIDPKTKLSVYTGDFVIDVRVTAEPGNHMVQGKLHYQACDRNECMPPKTITVPIDVIGK
jgi:methionine-rich copper-binding protein CopC